MEVHLWLAQQPYGCRDEFGRFVIVTVILDAIVQTLDERFR